MPIIAHKVIATIQRNPGWARLQLASEQRSAQRRQRFITVCAGILAGIACFSLGLAVGQVAAYLTTR